MFNQEQDQFLAIAHCDVVEWPKLSQAVRIEREQATHSWHVYDQDGNEKGIFYTYEAAERFAERYGFHFVQPKKILKQF